MKMQWRNSHCCQISKSFLAKRHKKLAKYSQNWQRILDKIANSEN